MTNIKVTGHIFSPEEFAACQGMEDAANNCGYDEKFIWKSEMADAYTLGYLWEMETGYLQSGEETVPKYFTDMEVDDVIRR